LHFGEAVHKLLGRPTPCATCEEFPELWIELQKDLCATGHSAGKGYDAGRSLAEGAFAATMHLEPTIVIETGVARGVTSRFILEALDRTGQGDLFSIDLPPMNEWHSESGAAVPERLRHHWHFKQGASRRHLPSLVRELAPFSLFVHDSLHTTSNVLFELQTVWPDVAPGGMLLVDDVEDNSGFSRFVDGDGSREWVVAKEAERSGLVGAVRKVSDRKPLGSSAASLVSRG
jgi:hypothetical protein